MRKKPLTVGLAVVLSFWALAQSTGFGGILEGFFGAVMSGLGQVMVPLSDQAPSSTLAACEKEGIPTSLRVTQVGTTRSAFCPGQGEVRATAGGDWTVSVNGSPAGTEVVRGIEVQSNSVTPVDVLYGYNPPREPVRGNDLLEVYVGPDGTRVYFNGVQVDEITRDMLERAGGYHLYQENEYGNRYAHYYSQYGGDTICYYNHETGCN